MRFLKFFSETIFGLWVAILMIALSSCTREKSKVQEIPPEYVETLNRYNNLGVAYLEQGKYAEAAAEFKKALQTFENYVAGHVNLALAYYYQRNYEEAQREFSRALDLDPQNPHALFNLGLIYKIKGKYQQALGYLKKVENIDPTDPFVHYHLGLTLSKLGKGKEAVRQFKQTLKLDPNNLSAHYSLARELARLGRKEEGRREMEIFRKLQGGYFDRRNVDLTYQEHGKYGMAMEEWGRVSASVRKEAKEPVVKFVDVTKIAGLITGREENVPQDATQLVSGILIQAADYNSNYLKEKLVPLFGSGGAFADYDGDGDLDIYIVKCSPQERNLLFRNNGDGTFTDVTTLAGVGDTGMGMGCTFGDYDNDGDLDLYVTNFGPNVLYRNNGDGTFTDVTRKAGVGDSAWSMGAAFADFDHDANLDLYVTNFVEVNNPPQRSTFLFPRDFGGQPNTLYRNRGNGTFEKVTEQAGVSAKNLKSLSVVFSDFDEDKDIDFYVVNQGAPNSFFSNQRDGTFVNVVQSAAVTHDGSGVAAAVGDYNGDGYMDLLLANWNEESFTLYRNNGDGTYSKDEGFSKLITSARRGARMGWSAGFLDYNNDGHLDIFTIDDQGYALFRNEGGGFTDVTTETGLDKVSQKSGRSLSFGDYDNDGDTDILVINNGGIPTLLRNDGGNQNNWLKVTVTGRESSNRSGIGVKVEVKAGDLWQKREIRGSSGYLSQNSFQLTFGLGARQRVDLVRVIWPSGIRQAQANVPANQYVPFTEVGKKASCPLLFVWNGSRYEFVTDFLGAGFIGLWLGPGKYYYPDPREYIKINREHIAPRDGTYSIKLVELMEEVDYLDEVKLYVIDHPAEVEIYPNERLLMEPPWAEYSLHAVKDARPPVAAVDDWGHDILPLIAASDRIYPTDFKLLPFIGYAEPHSIILDLGDLSGAEKILLVMYGWIDYWNSTGNYFAYQAGLPLIPPYLQVLDEKGRWVTVIKDMGYPAGMPKAMTLDLTGKFLTDNYKVKITTNMRIYWDQILVSTFSERVPLRTTVLAPSRAQLQWKGFPRYFSADGREPLTYDYHTAASTAMWNAQPGFYTRYGDVRTLLKHTDDMFVIMGPGDEVSLEFDATSLPELSQGWIRDFLLCVDGFVKERDPHTAFSATVAPLPFHGMSNYPYGKNESYPRDQKHARYLKEYNTRWVASTEQLNL